MSTQPHDYEQDFDTAPSPMQTDPPCRICGQSRRDCERENTNVVTVRIENTYACKRQSGAEERVAAPPINPSEEDLEEWWTEYVYDLTGDGHPCGEREHSYHKAVITDAPGRPELVGQDMEWMDE